MLRLYKAEPEKLMKTLKANAEVASIYARTLESLLAQIEGKDLKRVLNALDSKSTYPCNFIYSKANECIYVQFDAKERSRLQELYGKNGESAVSNAIGTIHFGNATPEEAILRELDYFRNAAKSWSELSEPSQVGRIAARHDEALAILQEIDGMKLPQSVRCDGWTLPLFNT